MSSPDRIPLKMIPVSINGNRIYNPCDYPPGLVAIPAGETMPTLSVMSFFGLRQNVPPDSAFFIGTASSSPAANRNALAEMFLALGNGFEWVMFCDSDMTPEFDTVLRLLSHGVDVVGAWCFTRMPPFTGCFADLPDGEHATFETRGLREVLWSGTGCLLVRRRVLEALEYPYFEHTAPGAGEDALFCLKARKAGFPIYVDHDVTVGHVGAIPITREVAQALGNTVPPRLSPVAFKSAWGDIHVRRVEEITGFTLPRPAW